MKKITVALLIILLLAGCGVRAGVESAPAETAAPTSTPAAETPAPVSTPTPEPAPDLAEDPVGYILQTLDQYLYEEGFWSFRFWIFPGSGPVPVRMPEAEFGPALREFFSGLDWEQISREDYYSREEQPESLPGYYGIQFIPDDYSKGTVILHSNDDILWLDRAEERLYFRAQGAEKLCDRITDLWPGPEAELGRVRIPPQETREATARAYLEEVCARLEANGHITDHEIRYLMVEPPNDSEGMEYDSEAIGFTFRAILALKPADPSLECWQEGKEEGTDWNTWWGPLRVAIGLDGEDGCYCLSYYDGGWPD